MCRRMQAPSLARSQCSRCPASTTPTRSPGRRRRRCRRSPNRSATANIARGTPPAVATAAASEVRVRAAVGPVANGQSGYRSRCSPSLVHKRPSWRRCRRRRTHRRRPSCSCPRRQQSRGSRSPRSPSRAHRSRNRSPSRRRRRWRRSRSPGRCTRMFLRSVPSPAVWAAAAASAAAVGRWRVRHLAGRAKAAVAGAPLGTAQWPLP